MQTGRCGQEAGKRETAEAQQVLQGKDPQLAKGSVLTFDFPGKSLAFLKITVYICDMQQ